ncbi:hypothetical protein RRG08_022278 [Elysia crispata]|uniref:Uncharacterized protein n=1 Tax=Elysia crispata TaxID=231223 RepID=A0AAE0ZQQ0_9GAST|nr:hypothetical protein RRG08_022278 [Elysia crispata]
MTWDRRTKQTEHCWKMFNIRANSTSREGCRYVLSARYKSQQEARFGQQWVNKSSNVINKQHEQCLKQAQIFLRPTSVSRQQLLQAGSNITSTKKNISEEKHLPVGSRSP